MSTATGSPEKPSILGSRGLRSQAERWQLPRGGIEVLLGIVALMWLVEIINWIDGYGLRQDGIYSRSFSHLWGIFTAPFIHQNFSPHLLGNTIPFVIMGLFIAWQGARRLIAVTAIIVLLGGFGTWLIGPAHVSTIGASGVVFGYATYLLTRGLFNRSVLELLVGGLVGAIFGGALLSSLVPHTGVSWQGHLCGGLAGVAAAYAMSRKDPRRTRRSVGTASPAKALAK